jgi:anti-anti-sigma regulatory factor
MAETGGPTGYVVIVSPQQIDRLTAARFRAELLAHDPHHTIVADMTNVSFCDSAGVAALLAVAIHASHGSSDVCLRRPSALIVGLLEAAGIAYAYSKALGGLRSSRADSPNTAWRNKSFRNYADYMQTREFQAGVDELVELARSRPTAVMCAEAVPWRCHRSLVADALLVRGVRVDDIIDARQRRPHKLTPFAHIEGLRITYPPPPEDGGVKSQMEESE